jgi:hypothetical protein
MIPGAQEWATEGLLVRLQPDGTVEARLTVGGAVLAEVGDLAVSVDGAPLELGEPRVEVDADELEVTREAPGLRALVRHAFDQAWTLRVVLASTTSEELRLDRVRLGWRTAPGAVANALAAGAEAAYVAQPDDGEGPVLVGRLRSGAQPGVDADGLELGPLVLPPGHRWAAQWRWEVVSGADLVDPAGTLPRSPWLDTDEALVLPGGPDTAVVAPGLEVEQREHDVRIESLEPGPARVELRAARGTAAYALCWAPGLDDLVDVEVDALLEGPTSPTGTVRLPDAASGLLVQDGLRRHAVADPDAAAEALELLAGLLVDEPDAGGATDPFATALLAREADGAGGAGARAGLDAAREAVLATGRLVPGVALAGIAVALAEVRAARPGDVVVEHLAALLAGADVTEPGGLELAVLLGAGDDVVEPGLKRLGARLGAGLPGRPLQDVGLEALAHAATVLALVDDATGQRLRRAWGVSTSELARRTSAQVRSRLAGADRLAARRAAAWLVLAPSG